jgi:hypothetical protein
MKIYIISNNIYIDKKIFSVIKKDDLIIFMNHHYHDSSLFNDNKKFLFIRRCMYGYWGYSNNYNNRYNKIYFVDGDINHKEYKNNIDTCEKLCISADVNNYEFKEYKKILNSIILTTPTTGFITYLFIKENYPNDEIFLIGFTGEHSTIKEFIPKSHNYLFEQKYYLDNNVKLLNYIIKPNTINNRNKFIKLGLIGKR